MKQYLDLVNKILNEGEERDDRTGTGTKSIFGHQMRFDLSQGFPLVTTKKVHLKSIIYELLWMLNGDTNVRTLQQNGVRIWDEWAYPNGDLGPVYGKQWRSWSTFQHLIRENGKHVDKWVEDEPIDQIAMVVDSIRNNPASRRHIVNTWNVSDLEDMRLPPCHLLFQFYVSNDKRLSCQLYQRSADVFLGLPFNIASYSLLTMMMAQVTGNRPGEFIHVIGDAHIYKNHFAQMVQQLVRDPRELPRMKINSNVLTIDEFKYEDFTLEGYDPHPELKGKVSV